MTESVEQQLADMDKQIQDMEAELQEESGTLVWGEVDAGQLVRREQRRGVLPRLIRAARIRRLELQKEKVQAELEDLYRERETAYKALEKAQAKKRQAEQEEREALEAWSHPNILAEKRERRIKDYNRQIAELKGER